MATWHFNFHGGVPTVGERTKNIHTHNHQASRTKANSAVLPVAKHLRSHHATKFDKSGLNETKTASEDVVSIFTQNQQTIHEVEYHIAGAKRLITKIRKQVADFELPKSGVECSFRHSRNSASSTLVVWTCGSGDLSDRNPNAPKQEHNFSKDKDRSPDCGMMRGVWEDTPAPCPGQRSTSPRTIHRRN
jgi:hypothetical protein